MTNLAYKAFLPEDATSAAEVARIFLREGTKAKNSAVTWMTRIFYQDTMNRPTTKANAISAKVAIYETTSGKPILRGYL